MNQNICEDGTTNYNELNNYCDYKWYDDGDTNIYNDINSKGPVTAMTKLYNATEDWINVPNMNLSGTSVYEDEGHKINENDGYGEIGTTEKGIYITERNIKVEDIKDSQTPTIIYDSSKPLKARLPKLNEVQGGVAKCALSAQSYESGTCSAWLVSNLRFAYKYSINNEHVEGTNIYNIQGYWLLSSRYYNGSKALIVRYSGKAEYMNVSNPQNSIKIGVRPVITVPISDLE